MRNEPETPWPTLLGLALCGALAYAIAWQSAPQNRATRELIINHLSNHLNVNR